MIIMTDFSTLNSGEKLKSRHGTHKGDPGACAFVDPKCSQKDNQDFQAHLMTCLWVQLSDYLQGNSSLSDGEGNGLGLTSESDCGFYVMM